MAGLVVTFLAAEMLAGTTAAGLSGGTGMGVFKALDDALFALFALAVSILIIVRGRVWLPKWCRWIVVLSIGTVGVSVSRDVPSVILAAGLLLLLKPFAVVAAFQSIPLRASAADSVARALWLFLDGLTLLAVGYMGFEFFWGANPLPGIIMPERFGLTPARSFFVHPGPFASVMLVLAGCHFARFLLSRSGYSLLLFGFAASASILALRFKTLLLLPIIIVLLYLIVRGLHVRELLTWGMLRPVPILGGTALVLASTIAILHIAAFGWEELRIYVEPETAAIRTLMLLAAIDINFATLGFGAGLGMFGSAVSVNQHYSPLYYQYGFANLFGGTPEDSSFITDQWWAWILGETGILGFAIFTFVFVIIARELVATGHHLRLRHPGVAALAYSASAGLVYAVLSGYADGNLTTPPTGYLICALAGLPLALARSCPQDAGPGDLDRSPPAPTVT